MLKTFVTDCKDCVNLLDILCEIDARLTYYGKNQYNNVSLMTDLPYNEDAISSLLHYKRIITKRLYFPQYAPAFNIQTIISRIKILLNK